MLALDSIDDDKENIVSRFWKWPVNTIVELVHMRWRLRNVAVEMYTKDGRSVFFAFANKKLRVEASVKLLHSMPPSSFLTDDKKIANGTFDAKEMERARNIHL